MNTQHFITYHDIPEPMCIAVRVCSCCGKPFKGLKPVKCQIERLTEVTCFRCLAEQVEPEALIISDYEKEPVSRA